MFDTRLADAVNSKTGELVPNATVKFGLDLGESR